MSSKNPGGSEDHLIIFVHNDHTARVAVYFFLFAPHVPNNPGFRLAELCNGSCLLGVSQLHVAAARRVPEFVPNFHLSDALVICIDLSVKSADRFVVPSVVLVELDNLGNIWPSTLLHKGCLDFG
jgi:hypothetical protein